jgi:hypothetical protein
MSKLFSDPIYKDMSESEDGWLELAIEPFRFRLNEQLSQLPERNEFGIDFFLKFMSNDYYDSSYGVSLYTLTLIEALMKEAGLDKLDRNELSVAKDLFELEEAAQITLDLSNETLSAPIVLLKKKDRFDDLEVQEIAGNLALAHINLGDPRNKHDRSTMISRMNEIMDLIGVTGARQSRSVRTKKHEITKRLRTIFKEDEWRIRNAEIMINAAKWIESYCSWGSQHALMNFTRLKCMTHKGNPIYSMEEIS